jgi:hypothetical protein
MNDQEVFHQFVGKSVTPDIATATYLLETLSEEETAVICESHKSFDDATMMKEVLEGQKKNN